MGFRNRKHAKIFILLALSVLAGCASKKSTPDTDGSNPFPVASKTAHAKPIWKQTLRATLSHLHSSRTGKRILISTSSDASRGKKSNLLRLVSSENNRFKVLWTKTLSQSVKSQSLSSDGKIVAVNTYDAILHVYDAGGRQLWQREHLGKPAVLTQQQKVLLFNDDDSEPETSFLSYDFSGKLLGEAKIPKLMEEKRESLDMYLSKDENFALVTFTKRGLAVFDTNGVLLWRGEAESEPISVSFDEKNSGRFYVLSGEKGSRYLTAYQRTEGSETLSYQKIWSQSLAKPFDTIKALSDSILAYGNAESGQYFSGFSTNDGVRTWEHSFSDGLNFSAHVFERASKGFFTVVADTGDKENLLHVLGISPKGEVLFETPVLSDDGIYSYSVSDQGNSVTVASGFAGQAVIQNFSIHF